jgi:hypothetical protein
MHVWQWKMSCKALKERLLCTERNHVSHRKKHVKHWRKPVRYSKNAFRIMKDIMLGMDTQRNLVRHWKKTCQAVKRKTVVSYGKKASRALQENMCGNEGIHVRHCKNACHVQQEIMSGTEKKFVIRWRNACQCWLWQLTMHVRHCQNAC